MPGSDISVQGLQYPNTRHRTTLTPQGYNMKEGLKYFIKLGYLYLLQGLQCSSTELWTMTPQYHCQGGYLRVFEGDVSVRYQPLLPLVQPFPPVLWHAVIHQQRVLFLERQLSPGPSLKVVQRYSFKDLSICQKEQKVHTCQ